MIIDRMPANAQLAAYLDAGQPARRQPENLHFTHGQMRATAWALVHADLPLWLLGALRASAIRVISSTDRRGEHFSSAA
jgi:hypothetical protein